MHDVAVFRLDGQGAVARLEHSLGAVGQSPHAATKLNELIRATPNSWTLVGVAQTLGLSERSLQRRLTAEGTTFDAVLDGLRRELSLSYLADRRISIAETAYLLGYSEPSAFHRAFKRWTGVTPAQARGSAA